MYCGYFAGSDLQQTHVWQLKRKINPVKETLNFRRNLWPDRIEVAEGDGGQIQLHSIITLLLMMLWLWHGRVMTSMWRILVHTVHCAVGERSQWRQQNYHPDATKHTTHDSHSSILCCFTAQKNASSVTTIQRNETKLETTRHARNDDANRVPIVGFADLLIGPSVCSTKSENFFARSAQRRVSKQTYLVSPLTKSWPSLHARMLNIGRPRAHVTWTPAFIRTERLDIA